MTRIRTIIIQPYDGMAPMSRPFEETEVEDTLETWQAIVGGWIAYHPVLPNGDGFFLNDEGKLENLTPNGVATFLASASHALLPGDFIAGTVAIIGKADEEGENTQADLALWGRMLEGIWKVHQAHSLEALNRADGP